MTDISAFDGPVPEFPEVHAPVRCFDRNKCVVSQVKAVVDVFFIPHAIDFFFDVFYVVN